MVVVTRAQPGMYGLGTQHSRYAPNVATVARAEQAAGGWLEVNRLNGLGAADGGFMSNLPGWAPWLAGGLVVGAAVGFFLKK